jgi:hypothetical protein
VALAFSIVNRLSVVLPCRDPRWDNANAVGGSVPYCLGTGNLTAPGFCHTSFNLVPPWMENATHPEWYGGDPTATAPAGGQLCWGDPSLVAFLIGQFRRGIL